jgi:hypothetical protein
MVGWVGEAVEEGEEGFKFREVFIDGNGIQGFLDCIHSLANRLIRKSKFKKEGLSHANCSFF